MIIQNILSMRKLFPSLFAIFLLAQMPALAQAENEPYKIIFQMVSGDTLAHKAFMKQLNNILSTDPRTQMEVVCHGPGLDMLVGERSTVAEKISHFTDRGVVFNACEFSMSERKVSREQMIPVISYVKAGILAVVEKQRLGWYYIKAGF